MLDIDAFHEHSNDVLRLITKGMIAIAGRNMKGRCYHR